MYIYKKYVNIKFILNTYLILTNGINILTIIYNISMYYNKYQRFLGTFIVTGMEEKHSNIWDHISLL